MPKKFLVLGGGSWGFWRRGGSANFIFMGVGIFPINVLKCWRAFISQGLWGVRLARFESVSESHSYCASLAIKIEAGHQCYRTSHPKITFNDHSFVE